MGKRKGYRRHRHTRRRSSRQRRYALMQAAARSRIIVLFQWTAEHYSENPPFAHDVIAIARKIAMGAKISIPLQFKRHICHGCKHYLKLGENARIRSHRRKGYGTWISLTCLDCGHITRYIVKGNAFHNASHSPATSK